MAAFVAHIHSLIFLICLAQSVSLYKILSSDKELLDLPSSSLNKNIKTPLQDDEYNTWNEIHARAQRSVASIGLRPNPYRRTYRPHWNPLVAAYKRCGELVREERESCFKDAVQMLFVHNLRK